METVIEFFFLGSKSLQTVTAVMRREWIPITVFLPAKSHEQRNLVGYSPWGSQKVGYNLVTKQKKKKKKKDMMGFGSSCFHCVLFPCIVLISL